LEAIQPIYYHCNGHGYVQATIAMWKSNLLPTPLRQLGSGSLVVSHIDDISDHEIGNPGIGIWWSAHKALALDDDVPASINIHEVL
jgi:hypothetical protein